MNKIRQQPTAPKPAPRDRMLLLGGIAVALLMISVFTGDLALVAWWIFLFIAGCLIWVFHRVDRQQMQQLLEEAGMPQEQAHAATDTHGKTSQAFDAFLGGVTALGMFVLTLSLSCAGGVGAGMFTHAILRAGPVGTAVGACTGAYLIWWALHRLNRWQNRRLLKEVGLEWKPSPWARSIYRGVDVLAAIVGILILSGLVYFFFAGSVPLPSGRWHNCSVP